MNFTTRSRLCTAKWLPPPRPSRSVCKRMALVLGRVRLRLHNEGNLYLSGYPCSTDTLLDSHVNVPRNYGSSFSDTAANASVIKLMGDILIRESQSGFVVELPWAYVCSGPSPISVLVIRQRRRGCHSKIRFILNQVYKQFASNLILAYSLYLE